MRFPREGGGGNPFTISRRRSRREIVKGFRGGAAAAKS